MPRMLRVSKSIPVEPWVEPQHTSKTVRFALDGVGVVGRTVGTVKGGMVPVELTLPNSDGILHLTGVKMLVSEDELKDSDAVMEDKRILTKAWEANLGVEFADGKSPKEVLNEDKLVVDYRDVRISGFLSTFVSTTPKDRDGDYVMDGAFSKTLERFKQNPVMLADHTNLTNKLAGSFTKIGVNKTGLAVEGLLSNAPDMLSVRFKVAEGHLKSLSMGGLFYYDEDGRGIREVELFEGSLTPIPANPDALFQVRSLSPVEVAKAFKRWS